jgi:hypothetical protein
MARAIWNSFPPEGKSASWQASAGPISILIQFELSWEVPGPPHRRNEARSK